MRTGKAFGILGVILGYFLFLFSLTFTFIAYPSAYKALWTMTAALNFVLAVFSAILFVGLATEWCDEDNFADFFDPTGFNATTVDVTCKPQGAGYCAVVAFLLFLGAGVSVLVLNNCKGLLKPRLAGTHPQQQMFPTSVKVGGQDMPSTLPHDDEEMITVEIHDNGDGTKTKTTTKTITKADGTKKREKMVETINDS